MSGKQSSYKAKFNGGTSYTYTNRTCKHSNTHAEGHYEVCNACNTIRANHGKRPTPTRARVLKAA